MLALTNFRNLRYFIVLLGTIVSHMYKISFPDSRLIAHLQIHDINTVVLPFLILKQSDSELVQTTLRTTLVTRRNDRGLKWGYSNFFRLAYDYEKQLSLSSIR